MHYLSNTTQHTKPTHDSKPCLVDAEVTKRGLWLAFQGGRLPAVLFGWHYLSNATSLRRPHLFDVFVCRVKDHHHLPQYTILGAKHCTPEIDTSNTIVDCQVHFPMDVHICDFWCNILP